MRERLATPTFLLRDEVLLEMHARVCEICKCRVATGLYLEGRGEGVSVEEGETSLDPPLFNSANTGQPLTSPGI